MAMADTEKRDKAWGTLEELLLACAISRHGTESWDFIALEVQKSASINNFLKKGFTPHDCEQRYRALNCRFDVSGGGDDSSSANDDGENYVSGERDLREKLPFMIDELRKLRVEELRREVERHDVSIVSLQSKVKRLEEERGRISLKAEEEPDLLTGNENRDGEQDGSTAADKPIPSEDPYDSNSTSKRKKSNRIQKPNPVQSTLDSKPDPVRRPSQSARLGNPDEVRASVSGSTRDAIQSSAVRKRRGWRRSNEIEVEKLSPANKVNVKPQPLIKFLEIVRSYKHGLVFQRRLPSQKTQKYKNMIRQHMDMETVESKLDKGLYFESHPTFYRDLLLVFTNALLFFRKSSTEHLAARELRKLVINELTTANKASPVSDPLPNTNNKKPSDIVVCRRRRNNNNYSSNSNTSSVKTEESESNGGLKAEPSTAKDVPMKLKRERSSLRTSGNGDEPSNKRRKEGAAGFVKRINRDSPEEEKPLKGRVSGRRSVSTTSKKNPKR